MPIELIVNTLFRLLGVPKEKAAEVLTMLPEIGKMIQTFDARLERIENLQMQILTFHREQSNGRTEQPNGSDTAGQPIAGN